MTSNVLIINGPNINMLGTREPEIYGDETLDDINRACQAEGEKLGLSVTCYQSNVEGDIVTAIQGAKGTQDALIINAGAYTHTSVAIMDALLAVGLPVIEVHLSHIYQREEFRHVSYVSKAAKGMISGFGSKGYLLALQSLV